MLHVYYSFYGKELPGKIVAIEKYTSVSRTGSQKTVNTYYRAIYEYLFEGKVIWFAGAGTGNLSYEIGQKVKVLSLPSGPEYCRPKNNIMLLFAAVFSAFGIGGLGIAWFHLPTWPLKLLAPLIFILIFLIFRLVMIKKGHWSEVKNGLLKNARLETKDSLAGREVYWTKRELEVERRSYAKIALLVSSIFFGVTSTLSYVFWSKLSLNQQEHVLNFLNGKIGFQEITNQAGQREVILFLILALFALLSTYSLFYSFFKLSR